MINVNSVITGCVAAASLFAPAAYGMRADGDVSTARESPATDTSAQSSNGDLAAEFMKELREKDYVQGYLKIRYPPRYSTFLPWLYLAASDGSNDFRDSSSLYVFGDHIGVSKLPFSVEISDDEELLVIQATGDGPGAGWYLGAHDYYPADKFSSGDVRLILHSDRSKAAVWKVEIDEYAGEMLFKLEKNLDRTGQATVGDYMFVPLYNHEAFRKHEGRGMTIYLALTDNKADAGHIQFERI